MRKKTQKNQPAHFQTSKTVWPLTDVIENSKGRISY